MHLSNAVFVLSLAHQLQFIVGSPADYPFIGTVLYNYRGLCGGVLYTTTRLITACHCIVVNTTGTFQAPHVLREASRILVDMGIEADRPSGVFRSAKFVDVHPKCKCTSRAMLYDYALIELSEPYTVKIGEIEVAAILDQRNAIDKFYESPKDYYCILLDFKIIPRKNDYDLGALITSSVTIENIYWCKDKYRMYLKLADFNGAIQICSDSEIKPCGLPDVGGPVICSLSEGFEDKIMVGLLSGRHHPYCGTSTEHGFIVSEVYARMDVAIRWLEDWEPTMIPTGATTSAATGISTSATGVTVTEPEPEPEPEPTDHTQTGHTSTERRGYPKTDTTTEDTLPTFLPLNGELSYHNVHPLLYPMLPFLLTCIST